MAVYKAPSRQTLHLLRTLTYAQSCVPASRALGTSAPVQEEAQVQKSAGSQTYSQNPDPETVYSPRLERKLMRQKQIPIGSRRRRMAVASTSGVPFEQLPYQCFQEARKIILADREEKLKDIKAMREKIARLQATEAADSEAQSRQAVRLRSMHKELEQLKIYADINDPLVKKRFEDGQGDMSKPIYRYLAEQKWRSYRRKILVQRITQMTVTPDIVPHIDPILDVHLTFPETSRREIPPGEIIPSTVSESIPSLTIQPFTSGTKLVTIAVVNPDVPSNEKNGYDYRLHFLACNIPISPTSTTANLSSLSTSSQLIHPWLPAFSPKGIAYARFAILIFEQKDNAPIDTSVASKPKNNSDTDAIIPRHAFNMRSFATRFRLNPIGAHLFRSKWDEETKAVMDKAGYGSEAEIEWKRMKVEPLPYKRRNPSTMRGSSG